jgi:hypothetical protein
MLNILIRLHSYLDNVVVSSQTTLNTTIPSKLYIHIHVEATKFQSSSLNSDATLSLIYLLAQSTLSTARILIL